MVLILTTNIFAVKTAAVIEFEDEDDEGPEAADPNDDAEVL